MSPLHKIKFQGSYLINRWVWSCFCIITLSFRLPFMGTILLQSESTGISCDTSHFFKLPRYGLHIRSGAEYIFMSACTSVGWVQVHFWNVSLLFSSYIRVLYRTGIHLILLQKRSQPLLSVDLITTIPLFTIVLFGVSQNFKVYRIVW